MAGSVCGWSYYSRADRFRGRVAARGRASRNLWLSHGPATWSYAGLGFHRYWRSCVLGSRAGPGSAYPFRLKASLLFRVRSCGGRVLLSFRKLRSPGRNNGFDPLGNGRCKLLVCGCISTPAALVLGIVCFADANYRGMNQPAPFGRAGSRFDIQDRKEGLRDRYGPFALLSSASCFFCIARRETLQDCFQAPIDLPWRPVLFGLPLTT